MKTYTHHWLAAALLAALTMTGCAATAKDRIAKSPDVFNGFPPDVQEQVRRGEVRIGFTKPMVQMALGDPDRVFTRQEASGMTVEAWIYEKYELKRAWVDDFDAYVYRPYAWDHRPYGGVDYWPERPDGYVRESYPAVRVDFDKDGKAAAIERIQR
ncbi:MAG: hypothetical protein GC159_19645 [Phycisphaera sp.]|nr:hypothetical protein [Phycisphaera sp.]